MGLWLFITEILKCLEKDQLFFLKYPWFVLSLTWWLVTEQTNHCLPSRFSLSGSTTFSLIRKCAYSLHIVLLHRITEILIHTHSTEYSRLNLLSRLSWRHITLQGKDGVISKSLNCSRYQLLLFSEINIRSSQLDLPKGKSLLLRNMLLGASFSITSGKFISKQEKLLNAFAFQAVLWTRPSTEHDRNTSSGHHTRVHSGVGAHCVRSLSNVAKECDEDTFHSCVSLFLQYSPWINTTKKIWKTC